MTEKLVKVRFALSLDFKDNAWQIQAVVAKGRKKSPEKKKKKKKKKNQAGKRKKEEINGRIKANKREKLI